jgi:hypothetical protein
LARVAFLDAFCATAYIRYLATLLSAEFDSLCVFPLTRTIGYIFYTHVPFQIKRECSVENLPRNSLHLADRPWRNNSINPLSPWQRSRPWVRFVCHCARRNFAGSAYRGPASGATCNGDHCRSSTDKPSTLQRLFRIYSTPTPPNCFRLKPSFNNSGNNNDKGVRVCTRLYDVPLFSSYS